MEQTTLNLLIILISIISGLLILALVCFISLILVVRRVLRKAETLADAGTHSLALIKRYMASPLGILSLVRMLLRRKKH